MPLLSNLLASLVGGLASLLSTIMGYSLALKLAAYTTWIAVTGAFLISVMVCLTSLWSMAAGYFSGSGGMNTVPGAIAIGLGVIVPSNAATVLSCCSAVWIAANVYKLQKQGLFHFSA